MSKDIQNSFNSRSNTLFSCLDSLEKQHFEKVEEFDKEKKIAEGNAAKATKPGYKRTSPSYDKKHYDLRNDKFKAPKPLNRHYNYRRKPADHVCNPDKWTKYSLKHDGSSKLRRGLSDDQLNTKIALDFLNDLRERKQTESETPNDQDDNGNEKILFKKPTSTTVTENKRDNTDIMRSASASKSFVMKTYEFGDKKKSMKEVKVSNQPATSSSITKEKNAEIAINLNVDDTDDGVNDPVNSTPVVSNTESVSTFNSRKKKNRTNIRKKASE